VAKRRQKLEESLRKGYATVLDQCSPEVRDKLKATNDWEVVNGNHSLHDLIRRVEKICVGFDDHRQSSFNLVQSLKTLYLYTQNEKESVEEYARNFRSLWNTVEAFGGSPGVHEGMVEAELSRRQIATPSATELKEARAIASEQVKAAMLISGADRRRYRKLREDLANNYLLGTDQYPDTFEKASNLLSNYQHTRSAYAFRANPNDTGVAFLQRGGRGGQGGRGATPAG
jgi:hypothetical protein